MPRLVCFLKFDLTIREEVLPPFVLLTFFYHFKKYLFVFIAFYYYVTFMLYIIVALQFHFTEFVNELIKLNFFFYKSYLLICIFIYSTIAKKCT